VAHCGGAANAVRDLETGKTASVKHPLQK